MAKVRQLATRIPARTYKDVQVAAEREGMSQAAWVRMAINYTLRRGEHAHMYREVVFAGRNRDDGSGPTSMLDWLAAGKLQVGDLCAAGGVLNAQVSRVMRDALTAIEYRRVVEVIVKGKLLEEVGQQEGAAKQAIHASITRATRKLMGSDQFLAAMCAQFPDSGMTPATLRVAREQQQLRAK